MASLTTTYFHYCEYRRFTPLSFSGLWKTIVLFISGIKCFKINRSKQSKHGDIKRGNWPIAKSARRTICANKFLLDPTIIKSIKKISNFCFLDLLTQIITDFNDSISKLKLLIISNKSDRNTFLTWPFVFYKFNKQNLV